MSRRRIRVSESFFEQLDALFPAERGPNGEPSRHDFTLYELPDAMERFAVGWDDLPLLEADLGGCRVLLQSGVLARIYGVTGLLMPDGSIELVSLTVEPFS